MGTSSKNLAIAIPDNRGTLSKLPRELRNEIYSHLFKGRGVIARRPPSGSRGIIYINELHDPDFTNILKLQDTDLTNILKVSKAIAFEASEIFYTEVVFKYHLDFVRLNTDTPYAKAITDRMMNLEYNIHQLGDEWRFLYINKQVITDRMINLEYNIHQLGNEWRSTYINKHTSKLYLENKMNAWEKSIEIHQVGSRWEFAYKHNTKGGSEPYLENMKQICENSIETFTGTAIPRKHMHINIYAMFLLQDNLNVPLFNAIKRLGGFRTVTIDFRRCHRFHAAPDLDYPGVSPTIGNSMLAVKAVLEPTLGPAVSEYFGRPEAWGYYGHLTFRPREHLGNLKTVQVEGLD